MELQVLTDRQASSESKDQEDRLVLQVLLKEKQVSRVLKEKQV
jgi:hypothetical protein